jgi:nicotinamidase-related amidase
MNRNYLIVIDVQNDFINGTLGSKDAEAVLGNICNAIKKHKGFVICTMDTHWVDENDSEKYIPEHECANLPVKHCLRGSNGWAQPKEVADALNEQGYLIRYVEKDSFGSEELVRYINNIDWELIGIDWEHKCPSFTIIGYVTDICVISNALMLRSAFPNSDITVYSDCCAGTSKERHEAALSVMQSCHIKIAESCNE